MLIAGVTGGIGSGKSAATDFLAAKGVKVVDADIAAREVVQPGEPALQAIADHFGTELLQPDGSLDRAALRKHIFADESARQWLEQLLHPLIRQRIIKQLSEAEGSYAVLASPLLLETDQKQLTQHVVVIDVPEEVQLARTMQRDNNNEQQVRAIIAAQMPRQQRLQQADSVIYNDRDLAYLHQQLEQLHAKLIRISNKSEL
ncbi:dephospho-CoA kinase [Neptuniibacter halophilus]|uniref:dephospho-CoA kinase n=1 Tax=Neptuniibacter halophilus TaxID=651666 RepID=UPI0033061A70